MKKVLFTLSLIFATPLLWGASFDTVMIDNLRYESTIASKAVSPKDFLKLTLGSDDSHVGGIAQDPKHISEGVPNAFLPLQDNSVWVLDTNNRKLKRFTSNGQILSTISLQEIAPSDEFSAEDFCPAPQDGFYVYVANEGKVFRISSSGTIIAEIEGVPDTFALSADRQNNVLIHNPAMNSVLKFNPEGELIEKFDQFDGLSPYSDIDGKPYGIKGDDSHAIVYKAASASPSSEIELARLVLDVPEERKAHYASQKILGVDASWNVYIELVAVDDDGVFHQNRIMKLSPQGAILGTWEVLSKPSMSPGLPRHHAVTPNGGIMGFYAYNNEYHLFTFALRH